jgi:hypothetical protein
LEHVDQFILHCGEASANDALKLKMFPLYLSGTAFTWFTSLAHNSIFTLAQLDQKFYEYFYSSDIELRCHILLQLRKNIMSMSSITLGGLGILEISVLI